MDQNRLIPLYLQAANRIKGEIQRNNFREGERLPKLNQLSRMLKINTAALDQGIRYLMELEIISQQAATEYRVEKGARERIISQAREEFFTEYFEPVMKQAVTLGISPQDLIDYIQKEATNS